MKLFLLFLCLHVSCHAGYADWFRSLFLSQQHQAVLAYNAQDYDQSLKKLDHIMNDNPYDAQSNYNIATILYRQKKYQEASSSFVRATQDVNAPKQLTEQSYFNLGNCYYQLEKWQQAVDAYRQVLQMNQSNERAAHNLQLALYKLKEEEMQKQQQQQDQNQQFDNQNQEQNKQENSQNCDGRGQGDQQGQKDNDQQSQSGKNQDNKPSQDGQDQEQNGNANKGDKKQNKDQGKGDQTDSSQLQKGDEQSEGNQGLNQQDQQDSSSQNEKNQSQKQESQGDRQDQNQSKGSDQEEIKKQNEQALQDLADQVEHAGQNNNQTQLLDESQKDQDHAQSGTDEMRSSYKKSELKNELQDLYESRACDDERLTDYHASVLKTLEELEEKIQKHVIKNKVAMQGAGQNGKKGW